MNKEAEILGRLMYWNLLTDVNRAGMILKNARLIDDSEFRRAFLIKKEIERAEDNANRLYKQGVENGERF